MFFIFSALLIISNNNLAFNEDKNIKQFSQLYWEWLNKFYFNSQIITGNIIKINWLPEQ